MTKAVLNVILGVLLSSLSGCVTPGKVACQKIDWYEVGRYEGAAGRPLEAFSVHQQSCRDSSNPADVIAYTTGRNAGLIEYCTPETGLTVGRSGQTYHDVCPPFLESSFLEAYRVGRRIFSIERENAELMQKIRNLQRQMSQLPVSEGERGLLDFQLQQVNKQKAQNDIELVQLEDQILNR